MSSLLLLKEDLGVSRATIPFTNLVYERVESEVLKFLKGDSDLDKVIIMDLKDLKKIYRYSFDDFIEFPIEEIHINLTCQYKKGKGGYATGGAAYGIDTKKTGISYLRKPNLSIPKKVLMEIDKTLISMFDLQVLVSTDYDESMQDELLYDLRDTIFHEFNHMYEYYMRKVGKRPMMDPSLGYSGIKNYNVPKQIFNIWSEFLTYVYFSEPHEINAMTQEMYSVRLRKSFDELKNHRYWIYANEMENFDANDFYRMFVSEIEKYNPDYVESVVERLHRWFVKDYEKFSHKPETRITTTKDILQLMKRMQPRINRAGSKLKRNFARLYAIETEDINESQRVMGFKYKKPEVHCIIHLDAPDSGNIRFKLMDLMDEMGVAYNSITGNELSKSYRLDLNLYDPKEAQAIINDLNLKLMLRGIRITNLTHRIESEN